MPNYELLSGAIGLEFRECSVAAGELRRQVEEVLRGYNTEKRVLYPIGDGSNIGHDFVVSGLGSMDRGIGGIYEYALIKPQDSRFGFRRVMRHAITSSIDVAGQEPQLVAILDGDAYITLGKAVNNGEGSCPYFSFGAEMRDPFSTTADEDTPRMAIIEEARRVIDARKNGPRQKTDELRGLLESELEGKEEQIAKVKEAQAVRWALEWFRGGTADDMELLFADVNSKKFGESTRQGRLLHHYESSSIARSMDMALVRTSDKTLELVAITRGNIALTLATLDNDSGKVTFQSLNGDSNTDLHKKGIETLRDIFRMKKEDQSTNLKTDILIIAGENNSSEKLVAARHIKKKGLVRGVTGGGIIELGTNRKEIRSDVDEYLRHPAAVLPVSLPFLSQYRDQYLRQAERFRELSGILDFNVQLESTLGPTTITEEELIERVQSMSTGKVTTLEAIAHNIQLSTTKGDARVILEIQHDGPIYNLVFSAAPIATGDRPRPVLRLDFDIRRPVFDRDKVPANKVYVRARDFLETLGLFEK